MRLGIVTDVHLNPAGTADLAWHNPYHLADAADRFATALQHCAEAYVDAIAVLGDLAHFGDLPSLLDGVRIAAASGQPVVLVPGNHDVTERSTALADAIAYINTVNVQLATAEGIMVGGIRLAGVSELVGTTWWDARATVLPAATSWDDGLMVWLTHFPMLSLATHTQHAGLKYPGDLANLPDVVTPLLQRSGPTVVLHGHTHVRAVAINTTVLQLGCAALIEPPFEVTVLEIVRAATHWLVHRYSSSVATVPPVPLPLLAPALGAWRFADGEWQPTL